MDRLCRVAMSAITAFGCLKAPMRFLPWGRLIPTLPPMLVSAMARTTGRAVHQVDAPHIGGGDEAGDIGDHRPTQGDDRAAAVDAVFDQLLADRLDRGKCFIFLAGGDGDDGIHLAAALGVERPDNAVGDDRRRSADSGQFADKGQQAAADEIFVLDLPGGDRHPQFGIGLENADQILGDLVGRFGGGQHLGKLAVPRLPFLEQADDPVHRIGGFEEGAFRPGCRSRPV